MMCAGIAFDFELAFPPPFLSQAEAELTSF